MTDSPDTDASLRLLEPFTLRSVRFHNRMVVSPMQTYRASSDGMATDWHFQQLAKWAAGGFGAVMTEALAIDPRARVTHGDLGLWCDAQVAPLARIAGFLRAEGVVAAAQLLHAGGMASRRRPWHGSGMLDAADATRGEPPWKTLASSADDAAAVQAASPAEISDITYQFRASAGRAHQAGFDVLEIHAAHGYLIHSFLSPARNRRSDVYGGCLANRMRLALEVATGVREVWPAHKPLFFRISSVDWRPDLPAARDGWTLDDSFALANALAAHGVDLIDCSSGGIRKPSADTPPQPADGRMGPRKKGRRTPLPRGHQVDDRHHGVRP